MGPSELRYTKAHAWMKQDGQEWTIGITQYAAEQMGDVIYVELPEEGATLTAGEVYGSVESAKTVEDLIAPLSGTVVRANEEVVDAPEAVNEDPYGAGWMLVVAPEGEPPLGDTLSAEEYDAFLQETIEEA